MKIQEPVWKLRKERCPCCDGRGELAFLTCPTCGALVLKCTLTDTLLNIQNLGCGAEIGSSFSETLRCISCSKCRYSNFRNSTSKEIAALGFTLADYK